MAFVLKVFISENEKNCFVRANIDMPPTSKFWTFGIFQLSPYNPWISLHWLVDLLIWLVNYQTLQLCGTENTPVVRFKLRCWNLIFPDYYFSFQLHHFVSNCIFSYTVFVCKRKSFCLRSTKLLRMFPHQNSSLILSLLITTSTI